MASSAPPARPPCPSCGYLLEHPSSGSVNFCPKCGQDLRDGASPSEGTSSLALLNTVVAERYRLLSLLGEGGMGAVYKAEHIRMGKALALKILRGSFAREPGAVTRFRSEAQIVSRLSHPHTIAVFDFGELPAADGFYLAMEYVPGRDLSAALRDAHRLPEARVVEIGQQILGSLAEAHDAGIVHRDMKPGNVMLMTTRSGEDFAKVLDFGIAKWRDEGASTTTSVGAIVGTPNYLSPEQARGELIDGRSDVYSTGALLYELLAGRPPFHGMAPVAVVSAHLHDPPPPLLELAPDVSEDLAAVVHKALEKKPDRRWASADEMRGALLQLASPRHAVRPSQMTPRATAVVTGDLKLASRDDFAEFEREVTRLRRSRWVTPALVALALAVAGLATWRWSDVYALLHARAPGLAAALPAALRPADLYDGEEHEPNNAPAQANPLPLPPGPDGAPGGGVALMRGHIGAKVSDTSGDIDVFRLEVPPGPADRVLVAEWSGEREGDGIRGLDVTLTLNRQRAADSERTSARLVASVDHGGPGRPEKLVAAVGPGTYYLAVREKHGEEGPVEKPTDWYRLSVRLGAPEPGEEVEPNDAPEDAASRVQRYPEWRALAERNLVTEARPLHGDLSAADADVLAVGPAAGGQAPALALVVPAPGLAVAVEAWRPDATDLDPPANADRVRFEQAGDGGAGEVLGVPLAGARPGAPALLRLKALRGEGRWTVLAFGEGSAAGAAALALGDELTTAGRPEAALEALAAFARGLPGSSARTEVLLAAGRIAAAAAALPAAELPRFAHAARALGAPVLAVEDGELRYRAAFEALVTGSGPPVEQAELEVAALGAPCTPAEVAARSADFLKRHPASALAPRARRLEARAREALLHAAPKAGLPAARAAALAAWKAVARDGDEAAGAAEAARLRLAAPGLPRPEAPLCR